MSIENKYLIMLHCYTQNQNQYLQGSLSSCFCPPKNKNNKIVAYAQLNLMPRAFVFNHVPLFLENRTDEMNAQKIICIRKSAPFSNFSDISHVSSWICCMLRLLN